MASRNVLMLPGPAMDHQLVLAEVRLVAARYGALVGLYPCMSPHVVISVTDHRKSFRAKCARVWFFVGMHTADMYLYNA